MPVTLEQILEMPNAVLLNAQVAAALEAEGAKRREFYEMIDEERKVEFINGEILFDSPAKLHHVSAVSLLHKLLHTFVTKQQLGYVGGEKLLISLTRNDYEPDICFFAVEKARQFQPKQMQFPAPDLVVEILSPSTEVKDRTTKFEDYAAHRIEEYWIVDPEQETIEQYFLGNEQYELLLKAKNGTINSVVLPQFTIQVRAVFDEQLNLAELRRLLAA